MNLQRPNVSERQTLTCAPVESPLLGEGVAGIAAAAAETSTALDPSFVS